MLVLTHRQAAVFTARRFELFDVVQSTLTYMHPDSRVHSFLSPLPYQVYVYSLRITGYFILVISRLIYLKIGNLRRCYILQRCLQFDMPRLLAFDLLRETDQEFEARTGWTYQTTSPVSFPAVLINVNPPQ